MADNAPPHDEVVLTPLDLKIRSAMAILLLIGYFGYLYTVTYYPAKLPGDTLGMVLGQLGNLIALVFGFYFGLSVGLAIGKKTPAAGGVTVTPPPDSKTSTTIQTESKPTAPEESKP